MNPTRGRRGAGHVATTFRRVTRGSLVALLAAGGLGCAGTIARPALESDSARTEADSLASSVDAIAGGFTNFGRLGAVRRRAAELGLGDRLRTEWIDWFSLQQNVVIDLPGSSPALVYVVAHYDKVDINPLTVVSVLANGLLDPLIAPLYTSSGAIDNGTGVAVALELGKALAAQPHTYSYRILLVGSEESGLRGSRAHVARLSRAEKDAMALAVVIDTTGVTYGDNCVMSVSDPEYVRLAQESASALGLPLGFEKLPAAASSDFEPFQSTSFLLDFVRGIKFNLLGGLLPQRSWFTGKHEAPVVFFSSCQLIDAGDWLSGLIFLPVGRLHGPRDSRARVDAKRLQEQYAIALHLLRGLEQSGRFATATDAPR